MAAQSGESSAIVTHHAEIATTGLMPGRYTASAIVMIGERPLGRVSRLLDIVVK